MYMYKIELYIIILLNMYLQLDITIATILWCKIHANRTIQGHPYCMSKSMWTQVIKGIHVYTCTCM